MRLTGVQVIEHRGDAVEPLPAAPGSSRLYFNTLLSQLRVSEGGPFGPLFTSIAALYSDQSTNYTSTASTTDVTLLRENAGAPLGFDLGPWRDGNFLLLWMSATVVTIQPGQDTAIFTPRIERTSGDIVLASFTDSYIQQFCGSCTGFYKVGPLNDEALLRLRCSWRMRFGTGTGEIDPDGSSTNDIPCSVFAVAAQVRLP